MGAAADEGAESVKPDRDRDAQARDDARRTAGGDKGVAAADGLEGTDARRYATEDDGKPRATLQQPLIGLVVDGTSGRPLPGLRVTAAAGRGRRRQEVVTDEEGLFAVTWPARDGEAPSEGRALRLRVFGPDGREIHATELAAPPAVGETVTVQVPSEMAPGPPSTPIGQLATRTPLSLSRSLVERLAASGISTVADIRARGGLDDLSLGRVPVEKVRALEAHAALSTLPADAETAGRLFEAGFTTVADIAATPLREFVDLVGNDIDEAPARSLHAAAVAEDDFVANVLAGERANYGRVGTSRSLVMTAAKRVCGCKRCEDALSPLAYLADLTDYALRHVRSNGSPIDLDFLRVRFHQPFGDFPVACRIAEEPVRQIRICIEILRRYRNSSLAPQDYLVGAYRMLLERIGTSIEEVRAARTAPRRDRIALANRLGMRIDPQGTRPDHLDVLFVDPGQAGALTEALLEGLFGLRDTNRPPLDPDPPPAVFNLRMEYLRATWVSEDWPTRPPPDAHPLVDPDIIGPADIAEPAQGTINPALQLWLQRSGWVATQLDDLRQGRQAFGLPTVLQDPLQGLDRTVAQLRALRDRYESGEDVRSEVAALGLDGPALAHLVGVAELDASGAAVLTSEWEDVFSILVQAMKRRGQFQVWRTEERNVPGILTLSPPYFRLRRTEPPPSSERNWRGDPAERRRWVRTLRSRIEREENILPQLREAASDVEEAFLPSIRELLLYMGVAPSQRGTHADVLSRYLQADVLTGACAETTRVAHAIETLQGLLFGARNGLLEDRTLGLEAEQFDEEWRWLGSYATWRAAMLVFLYPENALAPTLRRRRSPAFDRLVEGLRADPITAEIVHEVAAEYGRYFADVCSLEGVALYESGARRPAPPGSNAHYGRDVLIVAEATASGTLYASTFRRLLRPSVYPGLPPLDMGAAEHSFWDAVPGLPSESDVVALLPYEFGGARRTALFARGNIEGVSTTLLSTHDGRRWSHPSPVPGVPSLVRTTRLEGEIPADPDVGGVAAWAIFPDDLVAIADLAGEGQPQVLVMRAQPESSGQRRAALLGESGGSLIVRSEASVDGGWRLPTRPVILPVTLNRWPWRAERLLVVDPTGNQRIGVLGTDADGRLAVLGATTTVPGSAGAADWDVSVRAMVAGEQDETAFVYATPGGFQAVLAFEHVDEPEWAAPVGTVVTVLDWLGDAFRVRLRQPLPFHHNADTEQFEPAYGVRWRLFLPVRGRGDILMVAEHTQHWTSSPSLRPPANRETHTWLGLLRWDATQQRFDNPPPSVVYWSESTVPHPVHQPGLPVPGIGGAPGWSLGPDDQYLSVRLVPGQADEILAWSPSRKELGVLGYQPNGSLAVVWRAEGAIADWTFDGGETFLPVLLGGGRESVLMASGDGRNLGLLEPAADRSLALVYRALDRVRAPGELPTREWPLADGNRYTRGDLDGDGRDEIIGLTAAAVVGVLRRPGVPTLPGWTPSRLGPVGVTLFGITEKRGETELEARRNSIRAAYQANLALLHKSEADRNLSYLGEAYYFVPVELAQRLRVVGEYTAALDWLRSVYDHSRAVSTRKIAYSLVLEEAPTLEFERALDWLRDPLNPHSIAATRANTYSRATILAIVRCLLDFADAEYARETSESIARARSLYHEALDLLDAPEVGQREADCRDVIGTLEIDIGDDRWIEVWSGIRQRLGEIGDRAVLERTVAEIRGMMGSNEPLSQRLLRAAAAADEARAAGADAPTFRAAIEAEAGLRHRATALLFADRVVADVAARLGEDVAFFARPNGGPTGDAATELFAYADGAVPVLGPGWGSGFPVRRYVPAPRLGFCIPPNPAVEGLRLHAELALRKIRACRNIAGLESHPEPYTLPTISETAAPDGLPRGGAFPPMPYRFAALVERARELTRLARELEQSMLAGIESRDVARYQELLARHDLTLAEAAVRLKDLQVLEALDGVSLAMLQRERAEIVTDHYDGLLSGPPNMLEGLAVASLQAAALYQFTQAGVSLYFLNAPGFLSSGAAGLTTQAGVFSMLASFQRRRQGWQLDRSLGAQDIRSGQAQIELADDQARIVEQDRRIAQIQVDQAEAVLDFLTTKRFANADLYEWMAGVLRQVYRFFLQQATSVAKLAENQLVFERQEAIPVFIRADYWNVAPAEALAGQGPPAAERGGLTGSARLLRDLTDLDQYAFRTNERKLQLAKTISLAELDPFGFQVFRETGVLRFSTPLALFDRDFPGHVLRLVRQVRASLIALVPPAQGIRATLATVGSSRVVVGSTFETVTVQRGPESIALTSPVNATGLLDSDLQPELLAPFEGIGVDTSWEFSMPKAANQLDYSSIADLLLTIEYTAKSDPDYRTRLLEELDSRVDAERPFSFRFELQDQWFDLNNPDQTGDPMTVKFTVARADFPPNLSELSIRHVTLAFVPADGAVPGAWASLLATELSYLPRGGAAQQFTGVAPVNGAISTRFASGAAWSALTGADVEGEWTLSLPNADATRTLFTDGHIADILFAVTYEGTLPAWPE